MSWFQAFAFNFDLYCYTSDERALLSKWEGVIAAKYPEVGLGLFTTTLFCSPCNQSDTRE
jgi:hypothetical protein